MKRTGTVHPRLRMNARLNRERDRARARELRRLLLCGAAIVAPLLGYVWQRVDFIRVSYQVEELQKRKEHLEETRNQLTVERAMLLNPARIERVARKRLGLVDPHPEDVRRVTTTDERIDSGAGPLARDGSRRHSSGELMTAGAGIPPRIDRREEKRR